jgi:hypothetical protein
MVLEVKKKRTEEEKPVEPQFLAPPGYDVL